MFFFKLTTFPNFFIFILISFILINSAQAQNTGGDDKQAKQIKNAAPVATVMYQEDCDCEIDPAKLKAEQEKLKAVKAATNSNEETTKTIDNSVTNSPSKTETPIATAVAPVSTDGKKPEDIYKSTCLACHSSGVANAPKLGDKAAWKKLVASGMDTMLDAVIKGKGIMPPKGGNPSLTKEELQSTIEWMISQ